MTDETGAKRPRTDGMILIPKTPPYFGRQTKKTPAEAGAWIVNVL
jgi:hypothetical protein